jgi:hypothetical protein
MAKNKLLKLNKFVIIIFDVGFIIVNNKNNFALLGGLL